MCNRYLGTEILVPLPVWRCLLGRTVQDGVVKRLATEGETCWDDMCAHGMNSGQLRRACVQVGNAGAPGMRI